MLKLGEGKTPLGGLEGERGDPGFTGRRAGSQGLNPAAKITGPQLPSPFWRQLEERGSWKEQSPRHHPTTRMSQLPHAQNPSAGIIFSQPAPHPAPLAVPNLCCSPSTMAVIALASPLVSAFGKHFGKVKEECRPDPSSCSILGEPSLWCCWPAPKRLWETSMDTCEHETLPFIRPDSYHPLLQPTQPHFPPN